jgi:hypothetical protein
MNTARTHGKLRALLPRGEQRGFYLSAGRGRKWAICGRRRQAVLSLSLGGWLLSLLFLLLAFVVGVFRGLDRINDLRVSCERQNDEKPQDSAFCTVNIHLG